MKVSVNRDEFVSATKSVASVADARSPIVFFGQALVTVGPAGCTVSGTDDSVSVSTRFKCEPRTLTETSFAVDAKKLAESAALSHGEDVSIEVAENKVTLASGKSKITVATVSGKDYPALHVSRGEARKVPAASLADAIKKVAFVASSNEPTNPAASAVRLSVAGKAVSVAAVTGHRLACRGFSCDAVDMPEVSISRKGADQIAAALLAAGDDTAVLSVSPTGDSVTVSVGDVTVGAKTLAAPPMPWRNLLNSAGQKVVVPIDELKSAIARAALFSSRDQEKISIGLADSEMTVFRASASGDASSKIELPDEVLQVTIMLNARYLREALSAIDTANVEVQVSTDRMPILLRPTDGSDQVLVIALMDNK